MRRKCPKCGGQIVFSRPCDQTIRPKFNELGEIDEEEVVATTYDEDAESDVVQLYCWTCGASAGIAYMEGCSPDPEESVDGKKGV